MLHEELDNERKIQKGYKHNVEIWRNSKVEAKQKIKVFIKKLQDQNGELKSNTSQLKLQKEELHDLKQKAKIWETTKHKWINALFIHKKQ